MVSVQSQSRELADRIQAKIDSGIYRPGERLPSTMALATHYGVSPGIARGALHLLCRDNAIINRPYIGHFVGNGDAPLVNWDPRRLHVRIADDLRHKITSGEYEPGQRIPSMRELAAEHNVSTMPVRQAVEHLTLEGLLTTVHGDGVFVTAPDN